MYWSRLSIAAALALTFSPALADPQTLTVTGRVNYIAALQNGQAAAVPTSSIALGDAFTLTATYDFSLAELTALYDADPTVNIYYLPGVQVSATIGSYTTTFVPKYDFNGSLQLWNDRVVVDKVDAQSFEFFNYDIANRPYDMGQGLVSELINGNFFDFTATARNSDLISEWAPLSAFSSRSLGYGLLNADTNLFVSVQAEVLTASVSGVPEPSAWAMLIIGFGMVGAAMRRRGDRERDLVGPAGLEPAT